MNNEVNEVSNDLIIMSFKFFIVINFIILSIQNVKTFVKKGVKKGRPVKKKAFYRKITNKKVEGEHHTSLFVTIF